MGSLNDIKVGETYDVRVKVIGITKDRVDTIYVDSDGIAGLHIGKRRVGILRPVSPTNGTKNTDPAPKYDPCRLFRKGDVVEPSRNKGRAIIPRDLNVGEKLKVCEDEKPGSTIIHVIDPIGRRYYIDPAYLELVTPVEELEPFTCGESIDGCIIYKNGDYYAEFLNSEDAQRACKLLNAEHRKEQSND